MKKLLSITILLFTLLSTSLVLAQTISPTPITIGTNSLQNSSLGIATSVQLSESANDGDIIVNGSDGLKVSSKEYDTNIQGVITTSPSLLLDIPTSNASNIYPLIKSGKALVRATTTNGEIKKGDPIAASGIKGTGMKATKSGYIIGNALEDYTSSNKTEVQKILVEVGVRYLVGNGSQSSSIFDIFSISSEAAQKDPFQVLKYFIAAAIALLSIFIGITSFGKLARSGIEALGRNPLASRAIQIGIIFNTVICIIVMGVGLFLSVLILRI